LDSIGIFYLTHWSLVTGPLWGPNKVGFYLFLEIRNLLNCCHRMASFDFFIVGYIKKLWHFGGHPWHPSWSNSFQKMDTLVRTIIATRVWIMLAHIIVKTESIVKFVIRHDRRWVDQKIEVKIENLKKVENWTKVGVFKKRLLFRKK